MTTPSHESRLERRVRKWLRDVAECADPATDPNTIPPPSKPIEPRSEGAETFDEPDFSNAASLAHRSISEVDVQEVRGAAIARAAQNEIEDGPKRDDERAMNQVQLANLLARSGVGAAANLGPVPTKPNVMTLEEARTGHIAGNETSLQRLLKLKRKSAPEEPGRMEESRQKRLRSDPTSPSESPSAGEPAQLSQETPAISLPPFKSISIQPEDDEILELPRITVPSYTPDASPPAMSRSHSTRSYMEPVPPTIRNSTPDYTAYGWGDPVRSKYATFESFLVRAQSLPVV